MTALSGNTIFFPWEVSLIEWLQSHIGSAGISFISLLSMFGEELLLIMIVGFVYWSYDKRLGRTVGLSAIMGIAWNTMAKNIVLRRRPYFDHKRIKILRVVDPEADIYDIAAQGYSFPSGHSTNAATVFGALAVGLRKRWMTIAAVVIILFTGFSRVVMGAHYPTDVMVGWTLGLVSVVIVRALEKRIKRTPVLYGVLLITAVPGFFYCRSADYFTSIGLLIGFMAGTLLDDHCVHFENTRKPVFMIIRVIGGIAVYLVLNKLLKLPFSEEFLQSGSAAALLVRGARYAIIAFVDFGIYPMLFKLEKGRKKETYSK